MKQPKVITCVNFENSQNVLKATKGIYFGAVNIKVKTDTDTKTGKAAYFNGKSATIKVPLFLGR